VHPTVVADGGGLLVLAGLVEGVEHSVDEIVVLDATALLVAEYLALRHEGAPARGHVDFGLALGVVAEWFPVRALALEAAMTADRLGQDIDAAASLALAHSLAVPLVTKNRDVTSREIPVLHC
jgi:hypothetical protein